MRNLKRALSLTLASVMLLGMMVVGAGAASFPDVDEDTHNIEAIEVLKAVNVMIGDDNGNFGPDDPVNRAQMAVVMANLLNLDYNYYEGQSTFKDVPSWAVPYVAACYANGIVSGYNSYTYGSGDGVTAVQAASMMMRALGYFKYTEDYKDGFELVTVRQGTEIGIFDGIDAKSDAGLTRNQVARMALNALESEMVSFTGTPGTTYTASNGETLSIGYVAKYEPRTSTELKYTAIEQRTSDVSGGNNLNRGQYYIQLGEELYNGKLVKKYARDDFERPSINWQYNGKEIGTYVDYDLLVAGGTYTDEVKGSVLYDLLTYTTIRDNDLLSYVDGVQNDIKKEDLVRSNKNAVKGSGLGVLTEVFFDQERDEIIITSINTYLAKANSDYNKNNESLSLKVYTSATVDKANKKNLGSTTQVVDSAVVPNAADVKKDDFVLVYMSGKENANSLNNYPNYSVVKLFDVEVMSDSSVTKFSTSTSKVVDKLTTGGTEYKANVKAFYDFGNALETYDAQLLTNMTYNIFMDRYNNVIGVELEEGTKNYVFITGYDRVDSHISTKTAQAAAIFMDGTMDEITVNVTETNKKIKSVMDKNANYVEWGSNRTNDAEDAKNGVRDLNRWYTYTVNNNGTYTLKPVDHFMYSSAKETGITTAANKDLGTIDAANTKTLNSANLYLDDSRPTNANNRTYTNEGRAYGNDDTVYITVEPGTVDWSANGGHTKDAITDVKGVYKGIQNVKIELKPEYKESVNDRKGNGLSASYDESEKNAYVYSVFDSNYYIIASVVLGEAQGAAANYAYILGDVKSERVEFEGSSKSSGDATYYWEFDAFYKGEKVTLTAKTKYPGKESDLTKFHVQELRFDGDYVTSVKDVADSRVMSVNNSYDEANDKFFPTDVAKIDGHNVYDVGHVDTATAALVGGDYQVHTHTGTHDINNEYGYSDHRLNGTIELVGRTLYTEREKYGKDNYDVGLALRSNDTPALLIQPENGKVETTVCSSVSEAIGRLADADNDGTNGKQFKGRIVAALKDNIADWVVIISDTNLTTGKDPDYGSNTRYLDLYDDLGNSNLENPTTVTASNRKGDDRVIKGYIYRDTNDVVCTRYTIPVGYTTVVIQDQDIDAGTRFANGTYYINPTTMDEVINLRNNTITIAEMDRNVKISSKSSIDNEDKNATVTCNAWENVDTDATENMKIGDEFYVTAKEGYTVRVTGDVVALGNNEYRINGKNVTITVTENSDGVDLGNGLTGTQVGANIKITGDSLTTADLFYHVTITANGKSTKGVAKAQADGSLLFDLKGKDIENVSIVVDEPYSEDVRVLGWDNADNNFVIVWLEDGRGLQRSKLLPAAAKLSRAALAAEEEEEENLAGIVITIEMDGVTVYCAFDEEGYLTFSNKQGEKLAANIDKFATASLDVKAPAEINGTAAAVDNVISEVEVTVDMPLAKGATLPEKKTIDGVEVEIAWFYIDAEGNKVAVNGNMAPQDPEEYTYTFEIVAVPTEGNKFDTENPVSITVNDSKTEVSVNENQPVIKAEVDKEGNVVAKPDVKPEPEPDFFKVNVTVTPAGTARVEVNGAANDTTNGYEEGTEIELTITAEEGKTIKEVKVNNEVVTLTGDKYTVGAITADVTVEVTTEDAAVAEPATLTLVGGLADDNTEGKTINVKVTGKDQFEAKNTEEKADDTGATTYTTTVDTLKVGDEVTIFVNGLTNAPKKGDYVVGEAKLRVTVDNVVGNDGVTRTTIKFTMTGDITLGVNEDGKLTDGSSSAVETLVVTVTGGVKGTWQDSAAENKKPEVVIDKDGSYTVPKGGKIVLSSVGEGKFVITENFVNAAREASASTASGLYSTKTTAKTDTVNEIPVNANITLRSASHVKVADGAKAVSGPITITGGDQATGAFVPVGTELTLIKAANTDGFYADYSAEGNATYGTALGTTFTTGTKKDADGKVNPVVLQSGVKLNMEEGISATCGAAPNLYTIQDTDLVKGDTNVTIKVDPAYGTTAVLKSTVMAGVWAQLGKTASAKGTAPDAAITEAKAASTYQGDTICVMTKVVIPDDSGITLAYLSNGTWKKMENDGADVEGHVYVVPNSKIQVTAPSGVPTIVGAVGDMADMGGGVYQFTVGTEAVEIFVGTSDTLTATTIDEAISKLAVNGVTKVTLTPSVDTTVDASQIPAGKTLAFGTTDKNVTVNGTLNANLELDEVSGTATMNVTVAAGSSLKLGNASKGTVNMDNGAVEIGTNNQEVTSLATLTGRGEIKITGKLSEEAVPLEKMAAILGGTVINTVVTPAQENAEQKITVDRAGGHIDQQSGGTIESYWSDKAISGMGASSYISTYHFAFSNLDKYKSVRATFVKETEGVPVQGVLTDWMDFGEDMKGEWEAAFLVGAQTKSITFYFSEKTSSEIGNQRTQEQQSAERAVDTPAEDPDAVKITFVIPST